MISIITDCIQKARFLIERYIPDTFSEIRFEDHLEYLFSTDFSDRVVLLSISTITKNFSLIEKVAINNIILIYHGNLVDQWFDGNRTYLSSLSSEDILFDRSNENNIKKNGVTGDKVLLLPPLRKYKSYNIYSPFKDPVAFVEHFAYLLRLEIFDILCSKNDDCYSFLKKNRFNESKVVGSIDKSFSEYHAVIGSNHVLLASALNTNTNIITSGMGPLDNKSVSINSSNENDMHSWNNDRKALVGDFDARNIVRLLIDGQDINENTNLSRDLFVRAINLSRMSILKKRRYSFIRKLLT